jgi:hypothetical protein
MRRFAIAILFLLPCAAPAEALTIRDVIELSRAGVSEEVLLALIEVDRRVFTLDSETLKALTDAGVSQRVIVALVKSGRERPVEPPPYAAAMEPVQMEPAEPPPPQVVVVEHHEPPVREVVVPVPVYVGVPVVPRHRRVPRAHVETTFVPFQSGPPAARPVQVPPDKEPVYWGFGGKLRPDAWQPHGHGHRGKKDK